MRISVGWLLTSLRGAVSVAKLTSDILEVLTCEKSVGSETP